MDQHHGTHRHSTGATRHPLDVVVAGDDGFSVGFDTPVDAALKLLVSGAGEVVDRAAALGAGSARWLADAGVAGRATTLAARPLPGMRALGADTDLALAIAAAEVADLGGAHCPSWLGRLIIWARRMGRSIEDHVAHPFEERAHARIAGAALAASVALAAVGAGSLATGIATSRAGAAPIAQRMGALPADLAQPRAPGADVALAAPVDDARPGGTAPAASSGAPAAAIRDPQPVAPAKRGAIPVGKGMWLWLPERAEGGDANAIVARAKATGLTHIYVRTGSSKGGFYAQEFLNRILPAAHAGGIRVYGWDFPYFTNVGEDVQRGLAAIRYTTPDGHRLDGFVADIETQSEGTNITPVNAFVYGKDLREGAGPDYPLISCVPRPSYRLTWFPYAEATHHFDAIAPMVYWLNREPVGDVTEAMRVLGPLGKPIIPVGQAYDGAPEGGRPGVPPRHELMAFMKTAEDLGAVGASFWSWQHADQQAWDAIRDAPQFTLPAGAALTPGQTRAYQALLTSLGFPAPVTGTWDQATAGAVASYQQAAGLAVTGVIDERTRELLLRPTPPPVKRV